jgi:hypothetical protein
LIAVRALGAAVLDRQDAKDAKRATKPLALLANWAVES